MEDNKLQVACVGDYDETKEFCTKICRLSELCLLLNKTRRTEAVKSATEDLKKIAEGEPKDEETNKINNDGVRTEASG